MTKVQLRVVALEARDVHLRQRERSDFAMVDEAGQIEHGGKGKVLKVRGRLRLSVLRVVKEQLRRCAR